MKYENAEDMPAWRVGEFRSSADPRKRVLMVAVGHDEISEYGTHRDFLRWVSPQAGADGPLALDAPEPFVVKHYVGMARPSIKGNGFDGLEIGTDREEAQEFIDWLNEQLAMGRFSRGALRYEWLKEHMTQIAKDDPQLGTFVNLSFMEPGVDNLDAAIDKRMGRYRAAAAAAAPEGAGTSDVQVLLNALENISRRLPTDNPDYTAASCGDTARNALAAYRAGDRPQQIKPAAES